MSAITSPLPVPFDSEAVRRALHRLPARQRVALDLRFDDGLAERDVAAVLGCRPATAHTLIVRGLRRLRQQLAREGAGDGNLLHARATAPRAPRPIAR